MPGAGDSGAAFVDTNIWVYAHLRVPGDVRHECALALVQSRVDLVISPQVVAEYYSVMLRNAQTDLWIQANLRAIFARTRLQPANAEMLSTALDLRNRHGFSFWDCQIAAAALLARCTSLLTEDLQHGQVLDDRLRVVDPLREQAA
ncbi:MAG TPA: PIN domain-containing protein [Burkholderiaceae bacterium]